MPIKQFQTVHGPMLAFGGDLYVTPCLEKAGIYAPEEWGLLARMVQPGMTVVEIGANIGAHTVPLAKACAPGVLHAFEPQQRVFQVMCANLVLNGLANVIAHPDACGEADGSAMVPWLDYEADNNFGGVPVLPDAASGDKVRVITLDSLELPECGLIKIDVEGFEPQVLRGAAETIARCRPLIYTENDRPDQQGEVIALIDAMGYQLYWHTPRIGGPEVFGGAGYASVNMLCIPAERKLASPEPAIDPANWTSPLQPAPAHRK